MVLENEQWVRHLYPRSSVFLEEGVPSPSGAGLRNGRVRRGDSLAEPTVN